MNRCAVVLPPSSQVLEEPIAVRTLGAPTATGLQDDLHLVALFSTASSSASSAPGGTALLSSRRFSDSEGLDVVQLGRNARRTNPLAETNTIELPCGPAVASLIYEQSTEAVDDAAPFVAMFRAEFQIPRPERRRVVLLDVCTLDVHAWDEVSQEAVRIARSLRFLGQGESARKGEHLLRL